MRTIKELLQVMLEHEKLFHTGLCSWCQDLYRHDIITYDELFSLRKYIDTNRPSKWSSFAALTYRKNIYYWRPCDIGYRIKWIKKHLKK